MGLTPTGGIVMGTRTGDLDPGLLLHLLRARGMSLDAIAEVRRQRPSLPQLVCFDTTFHRTLPAVARRFPIADELHAAGLHRVGFHGLSCEHVVATLGARMPSRVIVAHLGNGASLTAIRDGHSVDTTMGLTPTGGVVMGTRTGDLDPGLLLHLLRARGMSPDDLDRLVNREGGLRAVGGSSDMQDLLSRRATDPRAALAVDLFTRTVRKAIAALAASLEGLDLLVFTGGIGEHAAVIRAEVLAGLSFLGLRLDRERNDRHADVISADDSPVTVRRLVAEEDRVMARHARRLLGA
ncbi:MAG: acetate/propionate family kinase [Myxococcales bacterium]|nr:MAG: acetate/propionate family kinase [Myxococcales bacterium]